MTPDTSPSLDPPFAIPMGLELRHLVDAYDEAAWLRDLPALDRKVVLVARYEVRTEHLLGIRSASKHDRFDALEDLRRVLAQSHAASLSHEQFAWLADRAAERKAAAR